MRSEAAYLAVVDPQDGQRHSGAPGVPLLGHAHLDGDHAAPLRPLLPATGHVQRRGREILAAPVGRGGCGLCEAALEKCKTWRRCCGRTHRHELLMQHRTHPCCIFEGPTRPSMGVSGSMTQRSAGGVMVVAHRDLRLSFAAASSGSGLHSSEQCRRRGASRRRSIASM